MVGTLRITRRLRAFILCGALLSVLAGAWPGGAPAHAAGVTPAKPLPAFTAHLMQAESLASEARDGGPATPIEASSIASLYSGALTLEILRVKDQLGQYWDFAGQDATQIYLGSVTPQVGGDGTVLNLWSLPLDDATAQPVFLGTRPFALAASQIAIASTCTIVAGVGAAIATTVCSKAGPGALLCAGLVDTATSVACSVFSIDAVAADCVANILPKGCDVKAQVASADGSPFDDAGVWITWASTAATSWENTICEATFYPTASDSCTATGGYLRMCPGGPLEGEFCAGAAAANAATFDGVIVSDQWDCGPPSAPNSLISATVEFWVDLDDGTRTTFTTVSPVGCTS